MQRDKGALCLTCADLDHLVFLPTGDATLTRRARKHSLLSAVVFKFCRARRRYERQGLLVEETALQQAETECLADSEIGLDELRKNQVLPKQIIVRSELLLALLELLEKELKIQLRHADEPPAIDEATASLTQWLQTGKT